MQHILNVVFLDGVICSLLTQFLAQVVQVLVEQSIVKLVVTLVTLSLVVDVLHHFCQQGIHLSLFLTEYCLEVFLL